MPSSDCGPPCRKLSDRDHRVHLLSLLGYSAAECYRMTAKKGKQPSPQTCETNGPAILRKTQVRAAIQWHRDRSAEDNAGLRREAIAFLGSVFRNAKPKDAQPKDGIAAVNRLAELLGWKAPARVDVSSVDQKWSELYAAVGDGDEAAQAAVLDADASDDASIIAAWRAWKERHES